MKKKKQLKGGTVHRRNPDQRDDPAMIDYIDDADDEGEENDIIYHIYNQDNAPFRLIPQDSEWLGHPIRIIPEHDYHTINLFTSVLINMQDIYGMSMEELRRRVNENRNNMAFKTFARGLINNINVFINDIRPNVANLPEPYRVRSRLINAILSSPEGREKLDILFSILIIHEGAGFKKTPKKKISGGLVQLRNQDENENDDDLPPIHAFTQNGINFVIYNSNNINIELIMPYDNFWLRTPTPIIPEAQLPQIDRLTEIYNMLNQMNDTTTTQWLEHIMRRLNNPHWRPQYQQLYHNLDIFWNTMRQHYHNMNIPSRIRTDLINQLMENDSVRHKLQILCQVLHVNYNIFN